jgi:hypothetical protein
MRHMKKKFVPMSHTMHIRAQSLRYSDAPPASTNAPSSPTFSYTSYTPISSHRNIRHHLTCTTTCPPPDARRAPVSAAGMTLPRNSVSGRPASCSGPGGGRRIVCEPSKHPAILFVVPHKRKKKPNPHHPLRSLGSWPCRDRGARDSALTRAHGVPSCPSFVSDGAGRLVRATFRVVARCLAGCRGHLTPRRAVLVASSQGVGEGKGQCLGEVWFWEWTAC